MVQRSHDCRGDTSRHLKTAKKEVWQLKECEIDRSDPKGGGRKAMGRARRDSSKCAVQGPPWCLLCHVINTGRMPELSVQQVQMDRPLQIALAITVLLVLATFAPVLAAFGMAAIGAALLAAYRMFRLATAT